jgi:hypothetical protein
VLVKKGQLSMEYIFLAVIVLSVSFIAFKHYKEESIETLSDATIKNSVDWHLSKAVLDHPNCTQMMYAGMEKNVSFSDFEYKIHAVADPKMDSSCESKVLSPEVLDGMRSRVFVVLGCDYYEKGFCMEYDFVPEV